MPAAKYASRNKLKYDSPIYYSCYFYNISPNLSIR
jgi:hypothetical protein